MSIITQHDNNNNNNEHFYESLDRILSSCSASCSESEPEPDNNNNKYDVWISEPTASISERRSILLRDMGLSRDPTLSRVKIHTRRYGSHSINALPLDNTINVNASLSADHLNQTSTTTYTNTSNVINDNVVVVDDDDDDHSIVLICCTCDHNSCSCSAMSSGNPSFNDKKSNAAAAVVRSRSGKSENGLPPLGKNFGRRSEYENQNDPSTLNFNLEWRRKSHSDLEFSVINSSSSSTVEEDGPACTIRNLDNGKEFVVNEIREHGMKLKEVGTGRQLTMEEFEMTVGHSPIVQELMRRQNVEDGNSINRDRSEFNGNNDNGPKLKRRGGWFKSIKNVASSVTGHKERRSSDERDTSSERGGRRSSSATDDSQDVSFHGPERVRVRQYGKSCKELTATYKTQEINAHKGSIWSTKFSLDGKYLASAGEDCVIHIWQVIEAERKGDLSVDKLDDASLSLLFVANGSPEPGLLSPIPDTFPGKKRRGRSSISRKSVSFEQTVVPETVFGFTEKPFCSFKGHLLDVLDLSWSKSQHLLSSSMDKTVRLWHLSSKTCLKVFSHSDYGHYVVNPVLFSNPLTGSIFFSSAENLSDPEFSLLEGCVWIVTCIQFNPVDDRYFISGSLDAKVRIWSIPDHHVVDWSDLHEMVTAACYTPDGQGALVGSYKGSCRLYNASDNKLQQKCQIDLQNKKKKGHHKKITGFQFVPGSSSEVLVTSADSRIRVVDSVDLSHKLKGFCNTNSQISASVTANGKFVVSASEDSYVYVWKYEADSRPNRTKSVTVTHSYEHFHCQDVSVAIPWPGIADPWGFQTGLDEISTANHPPTPVEEFSGYESSLSASGCSNSPMNGTISSATNNYLFDRISSTWPEEKLLLATRSNNRRVSFDLSNGVSQNMSAWGMVIVTAGLRGEIRTFQNFGLPVRI
ncbi:hypothetical protein ACFE04_006916 [Oxalis oulophora]